MVLEFLFRFVIYVLVSFIGAIIYGYNRKIFYGVLILGVGVALGLFITVLFIGVDFSSSSLSLFDMGEFIVGLVVAMIGLNIGWEIGAKVVKDLKEG